MSKCARCKKEIKERHNERWDPSRNKIICGGGYRRDTILEVFQYFSHKYKNPFVFPENNLFSSMEKIRFYSI